MSHTLQKICRNSSNASVKEWVGGCVCAALQTIMLSYEVLNEIETLIFILSCVVFPRATFKDFLFLLSLLLYLFIPVLFVCFDLLVIWPCIACFVMFREKIYRVHNSS